MLDVPPSQAEAGAKFPHQAEQEHQDDDVIIPGPATLTEYPAAASNTPQQSPVRGAGSSSQFAALPNVSAHPTRLGGVSLISAVPLTPAATVKRGELVDINLTDDRLPTVEAHEPSRFLSGTPRRRITLDRQARLEYKAAGHFDSCAEHQATKDDWLLSGSKDDTSKTMPDEDSDDDLSFRMSSAAELASAAR